MSIDAKGIIFDFDGVVVDSEPLHFMSEGLVVLRHCGRELEPHVFEATMGMSDVDVYRHYVQHYGIRGDVVDLVEEGRVAFLELVDSSLELMPGTREVLSWLSEAGASLCIASSASYEYIVRALTKFGLLHIFGDRISCVEMVTHGKPSPDVFIHAAGRLGLATSDCVVIEDSENGIAAAKATRMKAIRLMADGSDERADVTIQELGQLLSIGILAEA